MGPKSTKLNSKVAKIDSFTNNVELSVRFYIKSMWEIKNTFSQLRQMIKTLGSLEVERERM